jgi:hypothetical protein
VARRRRQAATALLAAGQDGLTDRKSVLDHTGLESIDYEAARASITSLIARPPTSADPPAPQPATARSLRVLDALCRKADIATPTGDEVDDATLTDFVERIFASS